MHQSHYNAVRSGQHIPKSRYHPYQYNPRRQAQQKVSNVYYNPGYKQASISLRDMVNPQRPPTPPPQSNSWVRKDLASIPRQTLPTIQEEPEEELHIAFAAIIDQGQDDGFLLIDDGARASLEQEAWGLLKVLATTTDVRSFMAKHHDITWATDVGKEDAGGLGQHKLDEWCLKLGNKPLEASQNKTLRVALKLYLEELGRLIKCGLEANHYMMFGILMEHHVSPYCRYLNSNLP